MTITFRGGEKFSEVPYYQGKKHGVEKRFRDGKIIVEEISWENDLMHGPYHTFVNSNLKTEWYLYGEKVSKAVYSQGMSI